MGLSDHYSSCMAAHLLRTYVYFFVFMEHRHDKKENHTYFKCYNTYCCTLSYAFDVYFSVCTLYFH